MRASSCGLLAGVSLVCMLLGVAPARADFVYGITDAGSLVETDTSTGLTTNLFATGFTSQPNALAYDATRNLLFYRETDGGDLYAWNRALNTQSPVATSSQLLGRSSANAAFYKDAYWFIPEGTSQIVRVDLDFSGPDFPDFDASVVYSTDFDPSSSATFSFGDIAITSAGMLYGNTSDGRFFRVDVSGATPTGYTQLRASGPSLQLALSADETVLFAQDFNSGDWFTVNLSGVVSPTLFNTTAHFRDLGGSAPTAAVPEPGALSLGLLGIASFAFWRRRRARA